MDLIKYFLTESEYSHHFCKSSETNDFIRFNDDNLPGMYTANFTFIKEESNLYEKIINELNKRKNEGETFLRIETEFPISSKFIEKFPIKPDYNTFLFMTIDPKEYKNIKGNEKGIVKAATTKAIFDDGIEADIASNIGVMGDFAIDRIKRKVEIYQQDNSKIKFYVCYFEGKAIGTCEMMIDKALNMVKIEDFDVLGDYQRKGFGSQMLAYFLKEAEKHQIDAAYVVTDANDTAKEMYKKCGFKTIGKKYELFFNI